MSFESHLHISAATLKRWLNDNQEIALLDVREAGQFGEGHPFFAVPLAYSRLELEVVQLVPRRDTRTVLIDADDGVAQRAADELHALGYTQVHVLAGGAPAWAKAGYTLFQGVNLPSKTFGELVELAYATPHISAHELSARQLSGEPLLLLDGRTFEEHRKMTLPGAVSVPNGELALRWRGLVKDAQTPIVVHCAGRTRSIIGAQILRSLGIPNPVVALENGTQGWALADLQLERGSTRRDTNTAEAHAEDQAAASRVAVEAGVLTLTAQQAQEWLDTPQRTTYVLDIRSAEEFSAGSLPGARHAPGGQLLQATDQTIGVRGSRVLLLDDEGVRAPVVAAWLRRLGFDTAVVEKGIHAPLRVPPSTTYEPPPLPGISADALELFLARHRPVLLDLQSSMAYRQRHPVGARWSVRPKVVADAKTHGDSRAILLVASSAAIAQLAAKDLHKAGLHDVHWTFIDSWVTAGLPIEATPNMPTETDAIDYLFFVHDRHEGNLDAARRYLAWETGLIAQCAPDELGIFRLPGSQTAHIHI